MSHAARRVATVLAYAMPAYLALLATLALHGAVAPWIPARDVLERHRGQVAVMVGVSMRSRRSPERGIETAKARYYVLVPGVLREPRLLRVSQVDDGPVGESSSRAGFWALLAATLLCIAGTWWFWFSRPPGGDGDAA